MLVHGVANFLLTDQGSNVDGDVIRQICDKFGIEKRRTSAYHSQGNGFAERSIRNVKEVFRTHLLSNNLHQNKWRSILKDIVFALNTTISAATKCVPYSLVHGRDAVIPEDVKLGRSKEQLGRDIISASDFADEIRLKLAKAYETVNSNLVAYRNRMEKTYNKSTRVHQYSVGDEVWLRKKNFKRGESSKLAPRRTGPWSIVEVLPNERNFRLRNRHNGRKIVVHHDRMEPVRSSTDAVQNEASSDSDESDNEQPLIPEPAPRRYPLRERTQRVIPGAVPWSAIEDV